MTKSPKRIFYLTRNGKVYGPYEEGNMVRYLKEGSILAADYICFHENKEWVQIKEVMDSGEVDLDIETPDPGKLLDLQLEKEYLANAKKPNSQITDLSMESEEETKPLAEWLGIDPTKLSDLAKHASSLYQPFPIHRTGKKNRWIEAPNEELKGVQRGILDRLLLRVPLNGAAHGFVPNRSILTHASQHRRKRWVVTLDIRSFFPSVNEEMVETVARQLPIPVDDIHSFLKLTTRNDHLPQGAPTSPTLGNLVLRELDAKLCNLVRGTGWFYTRYADDLTFSGFKKPKKILMQASQLIQEAGFQISSEKTRIRGKDQRQMVTGIVVNDKLSLSREKRNMVRSMRHKLEAGEIPDHELNHVLGWINFSDYVERCNQEFPKQGSSVRPSTLSLRKILFILRRSTQNLQHKEIIRSLGISNSSFYRAFKPEYLRGKLEAAGIKQEEVEKICSSVEAGEIKFALDRIEGLLPKN